MKSFDILESVGEMDPKSKGEDFLMLLLCCLSHSTINNSFKKYNQCLLCDPIGDICIHTFLFIVLSLKYIIQYFILTYQPTECSHITTSSDNIWSANRYKCNQSSQAIQIVQCITMKYNWWEEIYGKLTKKVREYVSKV